MVLRKGVVPYVFNSIIPSAGSCATFVSTVFCCMESYFAFSEPTWRHICATSPSPSPFLPLNPLEGPPYKVIVRNAMDTTVMLGAFVFFYNVRLATAMQYAEDRIQCLLGHSWTKVWFASGIEIGPKPDPTKVTGKWSMMDRLEQLSIEPIYLDVVLQTSWLDSHRGAIGFQDVVAYWEMFECQMYGMQIA